MDEAVDKRVAPPTTDETGGVHSNSLGCHWRTDSFVTEQYRASFMDVPKILDDWMSPYGGLIGKTVLDFGCGECVSGLGVALNEPTTMVVGVEVVPRIQDCLAFAQREIVLNVLPSNLALRQVKPGDEALPGKKYDFIFSWSVFEHIDQRLLPGIITQLRESLKPNGKILVQIAPLYYSSEGSHLLPWTKERWSHLSLQDDIHTARLKAAAGDEATFRDLTQMYRTLNRITYQELAKLMRAAGLKIEREYFSREKFEIPAGLLDVYNEDALRTNCVVYLCGRD